MIISKIKSKFKNISALDVYVTFSILSLVIYTVISQYLAMIYGVILDTLTTCFFGFFGGEIVTCGLIKIFKLKDNKKEDEKENICNNNMGTLKARQGLLSNPVESRGKFHKGNQDALTKRRRRNTEQACQTYSLSSSFINRRGTWNRQEVIRNVAQQSRNQKPGLQSPT